MYSKDKLLYDANAYKKPFDPVAAIPDRLPQADQDLVLALLNENKDLLQGTLGKFPGPPLDLELKPNAKPFFARPYSVPKSILPAFKAEVERMCHFDILARSEDGSPYGSPSFALPKKNGGVRFITNLRRLNAQLVRKPYPLPRLTDILPESTDSTYAAPLIYPCRYLLKRNACVRRFSHGGYTTTSVCQWDSLLRQTCSNGRWMNYLVAFPL